MQLIDASHFDQDTKTGLFCKLMTKSLGDKRREIPVDRAQDILKILSEFRDGDTRLVTKDEEREETIVSRIFPTTHFGYRKIVVERPLRLNFEASPERITRLEEERGFKTLAESKKKGAAGATERADGEAEQGRIRKLLQSLPDSVFKDRAEFEKVLDTVATKAGVGFAAPVRKAILAALSCAAIACCTPLNDRPRSRSLSLAPTKLLN